MRKRGRERERRWEKQVNELIPKLRTSTYLCIYIHNNIQRIISKKEIHIYIYIYLSIIPLAIELKNLAQQCIFLFTLRLSHNILIANICPYMLFIQSREPFVEYSIFSMYIYGHVYNINIHTTYILYVYIHVQRAMMTANIPSHM